MSTEQHTVRPTILDFDLAKREAENLARFTEKLESQRFWHIMPAGEKKSTGLLDTQTYLIHKPATELIDFLKKHHFLYCYKSDEYSGTLHTPTGLLWRNDLCNEHMMVEDAQTLLNKIPQKDRIESDSNWQLPSLSALQTFARATGNPFQAGRKHQLKTANGGVTNSWLTSNGRTDTDDGYWGLSSSNGYLFACLPLFSSTLTEESFVDFINRGWRCETLEDKTPSALATNQRWQNLDPKTRMLAMLKERIHLIANTKAGQEAPLVLDPSDESLLTRLQNLDHTPCRLPVLEQAQLSDPEKGLWELWGNDPARCKQFNVVARDPGRDVQRRAVAIDFGTSSTVVACDTKNGGRELLRIGVRDFFQPIQPQHFENPTVLECLDFVSFEQAWTTQAYRPALDWNWMRAAHEAQASFRDNPGDTRVLASILPRLKQWALRDGEHRRVQLTDRQGHEIELPLHQERNPLQGKALQVNPSEPFDPVELYAWYLGMAINWRGRGLFLNYYLSFPVEYPREVRERILASFRRGLQRSLPQSLIHHYPEKLNEFSVQALASEPAAYAAAALAYLNIEPTESGVPYAVYDFGGGTTDFDFGFLRWPNEEKEDVDKYEQVFEHLANSGDKFLGGENLLEHLAYQTFQTNLDELRKHRVQFTRPMDAPAFAGSEAFLAQTQAAQTNTVMLCAKLRPFMESDKADLPGQIKLDLINANGQKQSCELSLDASALDAQLRKRMQDGVHAFMAELARIRSELPQAPIHILLAGNGCRSRHIRDLFDTSSEDWSKLLGQHFGENPPEIVIHAPLPMDAKNPHAPTAKTGVALGLLHLVPGENTLLIDHLHSRHDGQAPFAWFVGRMRRRQFDAALTPSASYGLWHEIGPLQEGIFNLYTTRSTRAHTGLSDGDAELTKHRLEFAAAPVGAKLYARACSPHSIELLAVAESPTEEDQRLVKKLLLE